MGLLPGELYVFGMRERFYSEDSRPDSSGGRISYGPTAVTPGAASLPACSPCRHALMMNGLMRTGP